MSYYNPETPIHPKGEGDKSLFSIVSLKFSIDEVKEPLLIFDLPSDLVVYLDDVEIPSRTFDYFNPLAVDPVGLGVDGSESSRHGKLLFYRKGESEAVRSFDCLRLVLGLPTTIVPILESTVHYPPNFDIDYRTLTVSRTLRARQLCELFDKLQATPVPLPPQPILMSPFPRGLNRIPLPSQLPPSHLRNLPQPVNPLTQLFGAMLQPQGIQIPMSQQDDESPPSPSPALFLDPENDTFLVFQADDSDQNDDQDFDDEESDDDTD